FEMFYLYSAYKALQETRKLLKPSLKSDNKFYPYSVEDSVKDWWDGTGKKQQWDRRNASVKAQADIPGCVVDVEGMTILEAGRALYDKGRSNPATWYGNCGEQACIALYLCHSRFGVDERNLRLLTFNKGLFGHDLVQVGVNPNGSNKAAFCDPWMNIACYH